MQFQLFPTVEEQVENIAQAQTEEQWAAQQQISLPASQAPEQVPEAVIGRALTSGGNDQSSIEHIVAFFQKNPDNSAAAAFMAKEFDKGGKGVSIAGQDYALWFSEEGFRIAPGRSAFGSGSTFVPWANAAAITAKLLRDGMFATQDKIDAARDNELRELAEKLWNLRRDFTDWAVADRYLPSIEAAYKIPGFPDGSARIKELLENPQIRQKISGELRRFSEMNQRLAPSLLRFWHSPNPENLYSRITAMDRPVTAFHAADGFAPVTGKFVTEDEITRLLAGGPNISESKLQIYAYFAQGHNAKECANFLRESYGVGGRSYTGYDEWHDGKGIRLSRRDDFSNGNYDTATLNWNQVQKRIRTLIDKGRYLNEKEQANLPRYEKLQLARKIYAFQQYNPNKPRSREWDAEAAERDILPLLDDPAKSAALYEDMVKEMAVMSPDNDNERVYRIMESALQDMGAFQRGEYSLFTPLPDEVLQAERQKKPAKKAAKAGKTSASKERRRTTSEVPDAPGGELAAAARALAKKMRTNGKEGEDGQFNLFSTLSPAPQEPEPPTPEITKPQALQPANAPAKESSEVSAPESNSTDALTVRELYDKYAPVIKKLVMEDTAYQNASANSDRANAYQEGKEAVKRAALTLSEDAVFLRLYFDNTVFHNRLHKEVIDETYPILSQPRQEREQAAVDELEDTVPYDFGFEYRRLSVLKSDCEYFLGAGGRHEKHLSEGGSIAKHIARMRELYDLVPEKPEWLTAEDIDRYEARMTGGEPEQSPLSAQYDERQPHTPETPEQEVKTADKSEAAVTAAKDKEPSEAASAAQSTTHPQKAGRTRPELNYRTFVRLFPEIASGEYRYLRMESGPGMMPLHLQWIDTDVVAVSHTYTQNGDLMYDPEMTFRMDREKGTLEPLTFRQDGRLQLYQEVYPEPGKWIPKLRSDLSRFAQKWLKNISEQGYLKHEAVIVQDGEDVRLTFDKDGRAVEPAPDVLPEPPAAQTVNPVTLYEEAVEILDRAIKTSSLYNYLRDRNLDYNDAKDKLNAELSQLMEQAAVGYPDIMAAYQNLPKFREWLVDDLLERNYQDIVTDGRLAPERYADSPDVPEWARKSPAIDKSEQEQTEIPIAAPVWTVSPVTLYRDALYLIEREINRGGWLYEQLHDLSVDYDSAKEAVDRELNTCLEPAAFDNSEILLAYQTLPKFREWLIEDILERNYQDAAAPDLQDALERYADSPDFPEWAQSASSVLTDEHMAMHEEEPLKRPDAPAADNSEQEQAAVDAETSPEPEVIPEPADAGTPEQEEAAEIAEPDPTPNVEEYLNLKAQYPDKLIGIQVGNYMLFYGKDAEAAAPALGTNLLEREIPGLGITSVTGSQFSWQYVLKKLREHGKSVVLARPDAQLGPDAPYEIIKERDAADYIPLGMELTIDGRRMKIDSVDYNTGNVSLLDLDMKGRFPIFRSESIFFVRECVEEEQSTIEYITAEMLRDEQEALAAESAPEPLTEPEQIEIDGGQIVESAAQKRNRRVAEREVRDRVFPAEIVLQPLHIGPERHNFHITDDNLGVGGEKTKYQYNVTAIRTLKQIEAEGRLATPEEQEILSCYVGWGGIAQAFDPDNGKWAKEYAELKELLTPEEYASARATTVNAHYASPAVVKAIYQAVANMDYQPGTVLEPSMGIGNFFGLLPEFMADAKLHGVELDSLTGRIAKQLYQKADITINGFENTDHPDNYFDLAVGNVPFGEYHVHDRRYDRQNLLIHDYFITKTLDKVRPGGIVAFVTTKGTLGKKNSKVRAALAQKADLLGAIRLPSNAFKANAGTEVTTDILFFQKRDRTPEKLPAWVESGQNADGVAMNRYFLEHPEMVLGTMVRGKSMYGSETETACQPVEGADLSQQLAEAIQHINPPNRELLELDAPEQEDGEEVESIPADPSARNFSYVLSAGKLYFRENSRMNRVELGKTPTERAKGMIAIRDSARKLVDLQLHGASDEKIQAEQKNLNQLYDRFTKKYGLLSSYANSLAFRKDSSYPLLCSLEVLDDKRNFIRKADMFTKRTIQHHQAVTSVNTAAEALAVSIGERACVDLGFMAALMGGGEKISQIVKDLHGIIFKDPDTGPFDLEGDGIHWYKGWQTADEYLSGNVRKKLATARAAAEQYPEFSINVEKLEQVQPRELTAAEIDVHMGAPWVKPEYYRQFLFELLKTPWNLQGKKVDVLCCKTSTSIEWNVKGKSKDRSDSPLIWSTYGTKRRSAYSLFEDTLNLRDTRVYDLIYENGKEKRVINQKETMIAQQKQDTIKEAFRNWVFKDPDRRADLCATYNRVFNSNRPREYNGDHIQFAGMNPEYRLEAHQRNAVARMLYGGNALLAHCVGAGKTFEMIAAAMESKRLGLCQKSLFVVPNHLTEQWGGDFLTLYPGAKVLVATKEDFMPANRKKFCARIATGDYDAVVIGHTQFEKIPLSPERQETILEDQISEIMRAIAKAKWEKAERWTIKQMERSELNLKAKLERLHDKKKDDVVTFEELGIDRLFVDEAHYYKNLYMYTKMSNVAGISQTEAQKSSDMFAKCRYMDELTGGKGITFATGTPISNSMVELYTMMRYLQFSLLEEKGMNYFDSWAASFGEKVTAVELKPEGTGFRAKTRFARFFNLPELMNLWKESADIQTADMLKLPVPEAEYVTISTEPSEAQKGMVQELAKRAEKVRNGKVEPTVDNLLKITSDGRKLALDQRIVNPLLPDDPGSKVNACVKNVFNIWQESAETRGTQLIFSDLSTPKGKAEKKAAKGKDDTDQEPEEEADEETVKLETSVYEDIRDKLIAKGIPPEEIAFIHQAITDAQKDALFAKVRSGNVRILLGSTQKMGAGTNCQTKLVASHDLDCPWRPADLEQRAGRIIRRGNENEKVKIFRYVTKGTFDAYSWGLVENKQKFIGQVMTSKSPARSIEDVDATALSYAEVKMIATGDPRIKEKMDLDIQVAKLKLLRSNHMSQQYELEDKIIRHYPQKMAEAQMFIKALTADLPTLQAHPVKEDAFSIIIQGKTYTERKEAGMALIKACKSMADPTKPVDLGEYRGFPMQIHFDGAKFRVTMKQNLTYTAELSHDIVGNITRINNALEKIPDNLERQKLALETLQKDMEAAQEEVKQPFPQEAEYEEKTAWLAQLNIELDHDGHGDGEPDREDGELPARDDTETPDTTEVKPSIRQALRDYTPPAPAPPGQSRNQRREAAL